MSWHDAQHRLAGADDSGAIGPDQRGPAFLGKAPQIALDHHHVLGRNPVGDRHDEPDPRVRRLHDGIGTECGRYEDDACRGARRPHGFLDGVEHGTVEVPRPTFPWVTPPTTLVPYAMDSFAWKVALSPVNP